jgi:hypothetical protein
MKKILIVGTFIFLLVVPVSAKMIDVDKRYTPTRMEWLQLRLDIHALSFKDENYFVSYTIDPKYDKNTQPAIYGTLFVQESANYTDWQIKTLENTIVNAIDKIKNNYDWAKAFQVKVVIMKI